MTGVRAAVPLLRVADVERSIAWYGEMLGFEAHPFFEHPYVFAVLAHGPAEIMLKRVEGFRRTPDENWDVYIRLTGGRIRETYIELERKGIVTRPLMRMPYGDCEFEVRDPDGYVLCISELLDDPSGIPELREDD